jgi:membrane-bound ClpP family serine protease
MTSLKPYWGVALIVVGAILLLLEYLEAITGNMVLLTGLTLIIIGIVTHVMVQKYGGKY